MAVVVDELKKEFHNALTQQSNSQFGPSSVPQSSAISDTTSHTQQYGHHSIFEYQLEQAQFSHLRSITQKMNSLGHLADCVDLYKTIRKPLVDSSFKGLGINNLSPGDIRGILPQELQRKIELWVRAVMFCVRILFAREKKFAELIFEDEECFVEVVMDNAIQLFSFLKALTTCCRSTKMLFKILYMYSEFSYLLPDINVLFRLESAKSIRIDADLIKSRLEEVVNGILLDFEKELVHEMSIISNDDKGEIRSFTKYVLYYVNQMLGYKMILTNLITSNPLMCFGDLVIPDLESVQHERRTPLEQHLVLIIVVLRFKLEVKSRCYKDASVGHLFIMNNVGYILKQIKGSSELRGAIGEVYTNKLCEYIGHAMINYQSSTCDKLLQCLRHEGILGHMLFSFGVAKNALRKRVDKFNTIFEDFKSTRLWVVPELHIREELCLSIEKKLITAYKSFLERFTGRIDTYIKYSVKDLETLSIKWHDDVFHPR